MRIPSKIVALLLLLFQALTSNSNSTLLVTYTTGQANRLKLTSNLLVSVFIHSPHLLQNLRVVCLDSLACQWCKNDISPLIKQQTYLTSKNQINRIVSNIEINITKTCICGDFNITSESGIKGLDEQLRKQLRVRKDPIYWDRLWVQTVQQKARVAGELLNQNDLVIFTDADCVFNTSLDRSLEKIRSEFEGKSFSLSHSDRRASKASTVRPITALCDMRENQRANTGFMIVYGNNDTRQLFREWGQRLAANIRQDDQFHFQALTELGKKYSSLLQCVEEDWGFASYGHITRGISNKTDGISIFHANVLTSAPAKIKALKKLGFWYLS